jgi:hypothetical protein
VGNVVTTYALEQARPVLLVSLPLNSFEPAMPDSIWQRVVNGAGLSADYVNQNLP